MTDALRDRVARALHESLSRQDINGYLAMNVDCNVLADTALPIISERDQALVTAMKLARPIVEADLHTALDYSDADWIGQSQEALDAIDAALAAYGESE